MVVVMRRKRGGEGVDDRFGDLSELIPEEAMRERLLWGYPFVAVMIAAVWSIIFIFVVFLLFGGGC